MVFKKLTKSADKKPNPKKSVRSEIKKVLDESVENKWNYFYATGQVVASDALLQFDTCATTKGTSAGDPSGAGVGANRLGNCISQKRLSLRIKLVNGNPLVVGTQYVRMVIAYDLQQNSGLAGLTDLFMNATPAQIVYAPIQPLNKERWVVLKDVMFVLDTSQVTATTAAKGVFKTYNIKLPGKKCYYTNSNAGTYVDIIRGGLKVFFVSNTATASAPPLLDCAINLEFEDA